MRHVLSALVQNQPGVLAHISGMLASRNFNIDSLAVGATRIQKAAANDRVIEAIGHACKGQQIGQGEIGLDIVLKLGQQFRNFRQRANLLGFGKQRANDANLAPATVHIPSRNALARPHIGQRLQAV